MTNLLGWTSLAGLLSKTTFEVWDSAEKECEVGIFFCLQHGLPLVLTILTIIILALLFVVIMLANGEEDRWGLGRRYK